MLRDRVRTAAVGIPLVLLAFAGGRPGLLLLSTLVAVAAVVELARLLGNSGWRAPAWPGLVMVLGAQAAAWLAPPGQAAAAAATVVLSSWFGLAVLTTLSALFRPGLDGKRLTAALLGACLAGAYVAWPLALWPALYAMAEGRGALYGAALASFPLAVTWMADIAAYFVGRAWGRRRLAPALSPRKSVEGTVAGLISAVVVGWLLAPWLPWATGITLGVAVAAAMAGQLGDLWESGLKRVAGAKDSGRLVPGHGGVLDRFDAVLFAVPVAFGAAVWLA